MTIQLTPKIMAEEDISAQIHAELPHASKPLKVVFLNPPHGLFAGGGAARGVSGSDAAGYIAGNGLLTATTLGKIAGRVAAAQVTG